MDIVVIKHTSDYRGDHSADINKAYIFPENATLKEVMGALGADEIQSAWLELPAQMVKP
jgi:hypothetical protein